MSSESTALYEAWRDADEGRREHAKDFFVALGWTGSGPAPRPKRVIDHGALREFDAHEARVASTRAAYYESVRAPG